MNIKRRAVFIDRDGVINDTIDRGENFFVLEKKVRWTAPFHYSELKIMEGVAEAIEKLRAAGWLVILVTNQPDVTYGAMPAEEHERIMSAMKAMPFDDIYVCTHGRHDGCECKKPKPGMLFQAAGKWNIDLPSSVVVGDTKSDLEAARAAGCKIILIDHEQNKELVPDARAVSLAEAVQVIENLKK